MAQAMTPEQALQTIAAVRDYRERLTARAAGIVWLVWGLALSFQAFAALFVEFPGLGADVVEGDGAGGMMAGGVWLEAAAVLIMVAAGAALTNAVWRAHALETERPHAPWIPYVSALALAITFIALVTASNMLLDVGPDGIGFAPLALFAAAGAVAIAVLQRHRVPMLPGLLGALALLNLFVFGRFLPYPQDLDTQAWGAAVMALSAIVVYSAVGLWTMRKA